ncbi:MAG: bL28 family ribosomal protein [Candidatus Paceibacterota bacterium]
MRIAILMARICFHCGKGTMWGRTHTHHRGVAGGRWKKRAPKVNRPFRANLQRVTIVDGVKKRQIRLCAKCIKRIKFDTARGKKPFYTLAHHLPQESKSAPAKSKAVDNTASAA